MTIVGILVIALTISAEMHAAASTPRPAGRSACAVTGPGGRSPESLSELATRTRHPPLTTWRVLRLLIVS